MAHDNLNKVRRLRVANLAHSDLLSLLKGLKGCITEYTMPGLGHAQAGTIPDEPYRVWEYQNHANEKLNINNSQRTLDAAQNCYDVMLGFLTAFREHYSPDTPVPWHDVAKPLADLFQMSNDLESRIPAWKVSIGKGDFGFAVEDKDRQVNYDDREWFKAAVTVTTNASNTELYERCTGFESSNWKYFHDAAAFHRFTVLHEVLPEHGMICG